MDGALLVHDACKLALALAPLLMSRFGIMSGFGNVSELGKRS